MVQGDEGTVVFVDKRESGAGDVVGMSSAESFRYTFHESRLAGAEVSAKRDDERRRELRGQLSAIGNRLLGGLSDGLARHSEE